MYDFNLYTYGWMDAGIVTPGGTLTQVQIYIQSRGSQNKQACKNSRLRKVESE